MVVAAAMGRAGNLRAAAARWLRTPRFSTNGANGGSPATPGCGASTNGKTIDDAATTATNGAGIGKATVGGGAANHGGAPTGGLVNGNGAGGGAVQGVGGATGGGAGAGVSRECSSVTELRREAFGETGRVWEGYNRLSEVDRILYDEVAKVHREMSLNYIKSKEDLVSTTYKMIGSAGVFVLTFGTWASPYVHDSIVNDTVKEVERRARLKKGSAAPAADGDGSDGESSTPAAAPSAGAKGDTSTAGAAAAAPAGAKGRTTTAGAGSPAAAAAAALE